MIKWMDGGKMDGWWNNGWMVVKGMDGDKMDGWWNNGWMVE